MRLAGREGGGNKATEVPVVEGLDGGSNLGIFESWMPTRVALKVCQEPAGYVVDGRPDGQGQTRAAARPSNAAGGTT